MGENDFDRATHKTAPTFFFSFLLMSAEWYIVVPLAFALVVLLESEGVRFFCIYVILVLSNAGLSFLIILANDYFQLDVTLMEGVERVLRDEERESLRTWKVVSNILLLLVALWCLFYQGPAYVFLLLRNHRTIKKNKPLFVLGASFVQMLPWTWVYVSAYEGILRK